MDREVMEILRRINRLRGAENLERGEIRIFCGGDFLARLREHVERFNCLREDHNIDAIRNRRFAGVLIIPIERFEGWRVDRAEAPFLDVHSEIECQNGGIA